MDWCSSSDDRAGFYGINSASEEADISLGSGWRPKMEPKVANTWAISLRGYNVNTGLNLAVVVVHSNTLMFNNTPRCFERKKTCKPPPVSLKGLSCWHCFKQRSDWRAWWLGNNQVSQCATWMLANSLEQWLRQKRKLRSPYSLQSKWDKTKRVDNLLVLFPQVIPRSLVHGQADHCERQSNADAFLETSQTAFLAFTLNQTACTTWEGTVHWSRQAMAKFGTCHWGLFTEIQLDNIQSSFCWRDKHHRKSKTNRWPKHTASRVQQKSVISISLMC